MYGEVLYPDWGTAMGWCVVVFVLIPIPGAIVYKVFKGKGSFWKVSFYFLSQHAAFSVNAIHIQCIHVNAFLDDF